MLKTAASVPGSSCMWRINSSERPEGREQCLTSVTVILKAKGGIWEWVLGQRGPWQWSGWMFTEGLYWQSKWCFFLGVPFWFWNNVCVHLYTCLYFHIHSCLWKCVFPFSWAKNGIAFFFLNRVWYFFLCYLYFIPFTTHLWLYVSRISWPLPNWSTFLFLLKPVLWEAGNSHSLLFSQ